MLKGEGRALGIGASTLCALFLNGTENSQKKYGKESLFEAFFDMMTWIGTKETIMNNIFTMSCPFKIFHRKEDEPIEFKNRIVALHSESNHHNYL
jgi:hypothetical protein